MRKAKRALVRLTLSFPRKRITSPITFTFPILRMLLMIKSVAISEALKNPFPVIAIYNRERERERHETEELYSFCTVKVNVE